MARKTPRTKTITSRSLTLTTNNFCFDFTWRKVEMEEPDQSPLRGPVTRAPASAPQQENFASVLHRKQITELIAPDGVQMPPSKTLPLALGPLAAPSNAQVCRTYSKVGANAGSDDDDDSYI